MRTYFINNLFFKLFYTYIMSDMTILCDKSVQDALIVHRYVIFVLYMQLSICNMKISRFWIWQKRVVFVM